MYRRSVALSELRDARLWVTDSGGYTDAVLAAAAVARCTSKGLDVDDLVARAAASVRPPVQRLSEPGFTEPIFVCKKCGAWWKESDSPSHRAGC